MYVNFDHGFFAGADNCLLHVLGEETLGIGLLCLGVLASLRYMEYLS